MNNDALYKFTALGRPIDPTYPTNRAILILSLIAGIIAGGIALISGVGLVDSALYGLYSAILTVLAWIIAREIDPDHDYSAFVAAALAFGVSLFIEPTSMLGAFFVIPVTRLVNRTVGPKLKRMDTIIVIGFTLVMVFLDYWYFGFIAALAFLLDTRLRDPNPSHYLAALVSGFGAVIYLLFNGAGDFGDLSTLYLIVVAIIAAAFLLNIMTTKDVQQKTDITDEPLDFYRVLGAMSIALMLATAMLWRGDTGILEMAALWAAMSGVVIYRLAASFLGTNLTEIRLDHPQKT